MPQDNLVFSDDIGFSFVKTQSFGRTANCVDGLWKASSKMPYFSEYGALNADDA